MKAKMLSFYCFNPNFIYHRRLIPNIEFELETLEKSPIKTFYRLNPVLYILVCHARTLHTTSLFTLSSSSKITIFFSMDVIDIIFGIKDTD